MYEGLYNRIYSLLREKIVYLAVFLLVWYIYYGDDMNRKEKAISLIKKVMNGESYLTYKEIAELTGYHEKYLLKLKKDLINGEINFVHGNTNRKPINTISLEEKNYIIGLYKRSNASVRRFCKFYGKRSYSCIWHILKEAGLI